MQDLGTKVGQLGCLLEVQLMHGFGMVYDTRVVVVHTIDIGPYLNLLSTDGSTHERGCVVGTTTLQVVDLTIGIATDEALGDIHLCAFVLLEDGIQLLLDIYGVWLGVFVGTHEIKGI